MIHRNLAVSLIQYIDKHHRQARDVPLARRVCKRCTIDMREYVFLIELMLRIDDDLEPVAELVRYDVGDYVGPHVDGHDRKTTYIIALNDDYEGGETVVGGVVHKLEKYHLFAFNSQVQHEGLPVTKGTKYIMVMWGHDG